MPHHARIISAGAVHACFRMFVASELSPMFMQNHLFIGTLHVLMFKRTTAVCSRWSRSSIGFMRLQMFMNCSMHVVLLFICGQEQPFVVCMSLFYSRRSQLSFVWFCMFICLVSLGPKLFLARDCLVCEESRKTLSLLFTLFHGSRERCSILDVDSY